MSDGCCIHCVTGFIVMSILIVCIKLFTQGPKCRIIKNLSGKVFIITGANAGIGKETAKYVAKLGGTVIMACRNPEKALPALEEIKNLTNNQNVEFLRLDLSDIKSIQNFVKEFKIKYQSLDVLINNAGLGEAEKKINQYGVETTFFVNYVGPFYLTKLLLPLLLQAPEPRIVNVASNRHRGARFNLSDINFDKVPYSRFTSYANSKLANILFTNQLYQLHGDKILTNSLHPGVIRSEIWVPHIKGVFKLLYIILYPLVWLLTKNCERGAATTLECALQSKKNLINGAYYQNCRVKQCSALGRNLELSQELWKWTEKLTENIANSK